MRALYTVGALMAALALTMPVPSFTLPSYPKPIVINYDGGGRIGTYMEWYERLIASGTPVRIEGACISACTLVLTLPRDQVCVTDSARLGFHLASTAGGIPAPDVTADIIEALYPPKVRAWIKEHGPLTVDVIYMDAPEIVSLGIFKHCGA